MVDAVFFNINIQYLVAGFAGGIFHASFAQKDRHRDTKAKPWDVLMYVVVGGLAANFSVGPLLFILPKVLPSILLPLPPGSDGLIGVVAGMTGFNVFRRIDKFVETWNPFREN